ncbi:MAG: cysteine desulfurase [Clostridia bacterium]|nr:cysteine desulfurase [Clostridia bacterium]
MDERKIYLDNAATTVTDKEAADIAYKMMTEEFGNPSSAHFMGLQAENCLKEARKDVISALGYKEDDGNVIFTSCGTEADNMAVFGTAKALAKKGKGIVITDSEHAAVENAVKELEKSGFSVSRIPTKRGVLDLEYAEKVIDKNTVLVSAMTVNNETGALYDIKSLVKTAKAKSPECYVHTDAVQAFGQVKKLSSLGADLMSVSGHKIHAPKGVGALFVKKGVRMPALIFGGGQERNLRSGTESLPLICAFAYEAKTAVRDYEKNMSIFCELNSYLRQKLQNESGIIINSATENFSPHIISIALPGIRSEIMLRYLSSKGICVSAGSACSSKSADNRVLKAFGLDNRVADSTLRISFSKYNTKEDIDALCGELKSGTETLIRTK